MRPPSTTERTDRVWTSKEEVLESAVEVVRLYKLKRPPTQPQIRQAAKESLLPPLSLIEKLFNKRRSPKSGQILFQEAVAKRMEMDFRALPRSRHTRESIVANALKVVRLYELDRPPNPTEIHRASGEELMASRITIISHFTDPNSAEDAMTLFYKAVCRGMRIEWDPEMMKRKFTRIQIFREAAEVVRELELDRPLKGDEITAASKADKMKSIAVIKAYFNDPTKPDGAITNFQKQLAEFMGMTYDESKMRLQYTRQEILDQATDLFPTVNSVRALTTEQLNASAMASTKAIESTFADKTRSETGYVVFKRELARRVAVKQAVAYLGTHRRVRSSIGMQDVEGATKAGLLPPATEIDQLFLEPGEHSGGFTRFASAVKTELATARTVDLGLSR